MNKITTTHQAGSLPVLSPSLSSLADTARHFTLRHKPSPHQIAEATQALADYERALATPVTRKAVAEWMGGIAAAASNPPTEGDFQARVTMIHDVSGDLPMCVWTAETRRDFIRTQHFWPGAGEVDGFLRGKLNDVINKRFGLKNVAGYGRQWPASQPIEQPPPYTAEKRNAIAAKFRQEFAEAINPIREAVPATPKASIEHKPVSEGHLALLRSENPLVQEVLKMQRKIAESDDAL